MRTGLVIVAAGAALGVLAGCTSSDESRSAQLDTTTSTSNGALASLTDAGTRYVVAPTGNEARYRVREQLVGFDLPNDRCGRVRE